MKTIHIIQGSPEWLQFRTTRFGSSEAASMLGLSKLCTRTELLRTKHSGIAKDFSDWLQRNVLDKGHAVEAATRPMIEEQIADQLYPVVCQGEGRLAGSCDGIDLDGQLLWECKQWNEALAAEVGAGRVPDTHMPQCQHLLLVTGAERLLFTVSDGADRLVTTEVLPSPVWFERLRNGWAQFDRDLAAYTPPAVADPAPVGKAPDTLPALLIQVTGAVTASNLAEFKQIALAAIRSVNKDLRTDADFADADKAVRWCGEVEARLKAAKEHALSQTADIDALFKTLDDIGAEARAVRLDLDRLVTRRKVEVKESAVLAARKALDSHIADLNGELAPLRLQPVAADFPSAIKGLRSIASMQDALDTALAGAKIAADGQAWGIRANVALFKEQAAGLEFLFADLGQIAHKAADDFGAVLQARIGQHRAAEAERARKAAEAEAARIAQSEQRAREHEAARIAAEQAEAEREADDLAAATHKEFLPVAQAAAAQEREAAADANQMERRCLKIAEYAADDALEAAQELPDNALLLQDECRLLSAVLASKPDAPMRAREAAAAIAGPATLNLGMICARLGFNVTENFLADALGVHHVETAKAAKLYRESQWPVICAALCRHIAAACELEAV